MWYCKNILYIIAVVEKKSLQNGYGLEWKQILFKGLHNHGFN